MLIFTLQGAKITKSSHFNYQYVLGHKIVFLCVARGSPLPQITWFKDGVELYAHRYMQVRPVKLCQFSNSFNFFPLKILLKI